MRKFIHAADLHVDSPLIGLDAYGGAPVERIRKATRASLENLVKLAIEEHAAFLVLAGDTYDTDPLVETALFFRGQMQRLADAGIPVVIVRGNHDHAGIAPKNVKLPQGVDVLPHERAETVSLAKAGAVIHGQSYPRSDYDQDLVTGYPAVVAGVLNVGLLHTGLGGLFPEHGNYAPTSENVLRAKGYQYWALGHVHKRTSRSRDGVFIEFPGNIQGRHARETGAKGALVVEYDGATVRSVREVATDVMRWHHLELDASDAEGVELREFVKKRIFASTATDRESGRLCAVRVTLAGTFEGPASEIPTSEELRPFLEGELQAAGGELWLEKVRVKTVPKQADQSVMERRLAELAAELAVSAEARDELKARLQQVRKTVDSAYPTLFDEVEAPPGRTMKDKDVESALERAQELLRHELR
jgi:DNA repair protein SbcD/Mre11